MTTPMIPTNHYTAWFHGLDDYDVFSLPVVGLASHLVNYTGDPDEAPNTEWEPVVIDHSGNTHELRELDGRSAGYFIGGHLIGVTPATMTADAALAYLSRFRVALDPHAPGQADDEEMGTPIQRAQRQARGAYTWPTPWQPAA